MGIDIKEIKAITFPALFLRALSADFESQNITWNELYDNLFTEGTDIFREMYVTLNSFGLKLEDKVSYEQTFDITKLKEIIFELEEEDNGRQILINKNTRVQTIVPRKSSFNLVLEKMGYTQKVKKLNLKR